MAVTKEVKSSVIKKFQRTDLDTGSSEVQVAILTERIKGLTEHFKVNKHDYHGKRGLLRLVNRRRKLLDYLKRCDNPKYLKTISSLGLRK